MFGLIFGLIFDVILCCPKVPYYHLVIMILSIAPLNNCKLNFQELADYCIPYTESKNVTHIRIKAFVTSEGQFSQLTELKFEPSPTKIPVIVSQGSMKDKERDADLAQ